MKDNRLYLYQDTEGRWSMYRGALALAKGLEPLLARYEDQKVRTKAEREERRGYLAHDKKTMRSILEDPTFLTARGRYDAAPCVYLKTSCCFIYLVPEAANAG